MTDIGVGIQIGDPEERAHILRRRQLELADAIIGIAPVGGIIHGDLECLANRGRRHLVRLPHPEVEQFHGRPGRTGRRLGTLDFLEFINLVGGSKRAATNPVRKHLLNVHKRSPLF